MCVCPTNYYVGNDVVDNFIFASTPLAIHSRYNTRQRKKKTNQQRTLPGKSTSSKMCSEDHAMLVI